METEDSDEEEVIVYANFEKGTIEKDIFNLPDLNWKIIGLDSETPILQMGETTFKGEWNDTIGTKLLFEEDPSPGQVDPAFTVLPSTMLKYMGQTTKTLDFTRIFLKPKNSGPEPVNVEPEPKVTKPRIRKIEVNNDDDDDIDDEIDDESNSFSKTDVMDLAESTMNPTNETDSVMESIIDETIAEV